MEGVVRFACRAVGRPMARRSAKLALQAGATFVVVASLYGGPLVVSGLLALFGPGGATTDTLFVGDDPSREPVVWMPPAPRTPDAPGEDGLAGSPSNEPVPETDPVATPADTLAMASDSPAQAVRKKVRKPPRKRRLQRARVKRPRKAPRQLSAKEQKKRDRRKKRLERRAERKQCAELIGQIVEVDQDTWWVGRELVNCYRTHPEQFIAMGGAWWAEDDGKKVGVRLHVSSRKRGDLARRAGFRKGDVVMSINGLPIRSKAGGALAMTQLLRGRARIKIVRAKKPRTLKYRVVSEKRLDAKRLEVEALASSSEDLP